MITRFATSVVGTSARIHHVRDGNEGITIRTGLRQITARLAAGGELL